MQGDGPSRDDIPIAADILDALQPSSPGLLTVYELADRWRMRPRSFERWRKNGYGPPWLKMRGQILYRLSDVLAFEASLLRDGSPEDKSPKRRRRNAAR